MNICFLPIDNRPVCYNLAQDIVNLDDSINLHLPPRKLLGDLTKQADIEGLLNWFQDIPKSDVIILSLDTIAYGGLISSRRSIESLEDIKNRLYKLKTVLQKNDAKILAFSSIMRISNNNYNEEEKEYWKDYGKKIFEYSYKLHKQGFADTDVPEDIIEDYLSTRVRNFEINKLYLQWQKEGFFDTLIFSKDDCAEFGLNVKEARELELLGGKTKTGADEIPLTLLARALRREIKVFVTYTEPDYINKISNYEDVAIEKSVNGQLELAGINRVDNIEESDIVLIVNNFKEKQGELVMGWDTEPFNGDLLLPQKPYFIADVRYANGADNNFVKELLLKINLNNFYGYSGWNTSANTLGSLLAGMKFKYSAQNYNDESFKCLQMIRFLDDWAYQANVRGKIDKPCEIKELMKPYEQTLKRCLNYDFKAEINYIYPWNRKFEIEVVLDNVD